MVYIFTGHDTYSICRELSKLKSELDAGDLIEANTSQVEASEASPDDLALIISAMPFLASKRLVIIRGLIDRFEPGASRAKSKKSTLPSPDKKLAGRFAEIVCQKPDSTILVMTGSSISRSNPLVNAIGDQVNCKEFPLLKGRQLEEWINKRVKDYGGSISRGALTALVEQAGPDLWSMANEVDKLLLFTDGKEITPRDVARLVPLAPEANIFRMIDAVVEGKSNRAEVELKKLIEDGTSPSQILAMLTRQVRMVIVAKDMQNNGCRENEIKKRLGINHDFILHKTLGQARRYHLPQLKEFYRKIVETDAAIKTSRREPELALHILVEDISRFASKRA